MHLDKFDSSIAPTQIRGIMSSAIAMLLEVKWQPHAFNCWQDPDGKFLVLDDFRVSIHNFSKHTVSFFTKLDLDRARRHFNGKGIERGIDWDASLKAIKSHKSPEQYPYKCALETILSGATWPLSRIAVHTSVDTLCPRCGKEPEDSLHCFWTCPANENLTSVNVIATQKYIPTAILESVNEPCLWLRGLLPAHYTAIPHSSYPINNLHVITTIPSAV